MTAGVEGLPTDARDRLMGALVTAGWRVAEANAVVIDALLPVVRELCDEARADETKKTLITWQWGAWADLPVSGVNRIAIGQHVTDWLRARADALTAARQHQASPDCWCKPVADGIGWRHQ